MEPRIIDAEIDLVPYYPDYERTLAWYQDPELCRQVDNIGHVYSRERLEAMYTYLCSHGSCFYIRYNGLPVGDLTLQDNGEISIVICREYQNRHIGRRCIPAMLALAQEKGFQEAKAVIYPFNGQSRRMFQSAGFVKEGEKDGGELYVFRFGQDE